VEGDSDVIFGPGKCALDSDDRAVGAIADVALGLASRMEAAVAHAGDDLVPDGEAAAAGGVDLGVTEFAGVAA
jgi:hypothetical protein